MTIASIRSYDLDIILDYAGLRKFKEKAVLKVKGGVLLALLITYFFLLFNCFF